MKSDVLKLLTLIIACALMFPKSAHAYLDPGSGSYIIQLIIGAVLGAGFAVKMYWHKIKAKFIGSIRKTNDKNKSSDEDE